MKTDYTLHEICLTFL